MNNAGTGFVGALEEVDEQSARDHLDRNLFGAMWVSRAAIRHLRAQGGGAVAQVGIRTTIAQLGGFATDWAGSSMPFAAPRVEYDELRTGLEPDCSAPRRCRARQRTPTPPRPMPIQLPRPTLCSRTCQTLTIPSEC